MKGVEWRGQNRCIQHILWFPGPLIHPCPERESSHGICVAEDGFTTGLGSALGPAGEKPVPSKKAGGVRASHPSEEQQFQTRKMENKYINLNCFSAQRTICTLGFRVPLRGQSTRNVSDHQKGSKTSFDTAEPKHEEILPQNLPPVLKGPVQVQHQHKGGWAATVDLLCHSKMIPSASHQTVQWEFLF